QGMLKTFERFADQQLFSSRNIDPYFLSHPMARERISSLQHVAQQSPHFNRRDPESLQLRHDLMRAKLSGFLEHKDTVAQRYPQSDTSLPARYARAISLYLHVDVRQGVREIDKLLKDVPGNPYFWELKGQALLESGRPGEAIPPLKRAISLAPNADLIRMMLGKALLATEKSQNLDAAIAELNRALTREPDASDGLRQLAIAYGRKGDIARAELATARAYFAEGDLNQAKQHAARVQKRTQRGSPLWLQADDILTFRAPSRN
ncbi:MAG: tetratricopeptide repeat protein, partial [Fimbriimonadaceae bacterium]|nr:tetratricopeptide repeat protein [Alphaproteobacteria bacterium]